MKRIFFYLFIIPFILLSCVDEYTPEVELGQNKLVIKSEIDASSTYPLMQISTSFSNGSDPVLLNGDLQVSLYENGDTRPKPFTLVGDNGQLWRSEEPISFKKGVLYFLNIDATPYGLLPVLAETPVPFPAEFDLVDASYNSGTNLLKARIKLQKPPGNKLYYHLDAYIIDNDGEKIKIEVLNTIDDSNAVHKLESKTGILIEYELLPIDKYLSISVDFESFGEISSLINDNLYLELRTITEDYYLYYVSLDNHLETIQNPFSLPNITFSNITNGYGLFTAFSTTLDSVRIQ